ncbi:MAG TPA: nuclear transport factor 2 family protein, partial [Acidimicrobiales bacterium]
AELAVRNLIARVAHVADGGDLEESRELYTEDAAWEFPGNAPRHGRDDILADARQRRDEGVTGPGSATRHVITTLVVTVGGVAEGMATADSYWLYYRDTTTAPVLAGMGQYHDTVRYDDGAWRIARRQIMVG